MFRRRIETARMERVAAPASNTHHRRNRVKG